MRPQPVIDARTGEEIVAQGKALGAEYTPDWTPRDGERGLAMLSLFGRLMEIVISRLNRMPEKSFLAFLDTAGLSLLPPKAARAPVRFVAAEGAPDDGAAPAGTQIATAPPSGEDPATFETEKSLVVHRARLLHLFTLDPADDTYDDRGGVLRANEQNASLAFPPFVGTTLIPHRLYLAQDTLFRINHPTTVVLEFTLSAWDAAHDSFFRNKLLWKTWAAGEEKDITPPASAVTANAAAAKITITFGSSLVTKIGPKPVAGEGQAHAWIWAETREPLSPVEATIQIASLGIATAAEDIPPAAAFFNTAPLDTTQAFSPFGERPKLNDTLYLACREAFSKEDSRVMIGLTYRSGAASADCSLQWEFWNGSAWEPLGTSTSNGPVTHSGPHLFSDPTAAFGGTIFGDSAAASVLGVLALKQDVTVSIANAGSGAAHRFKLTVSAGATAVESHDELEMSSVEERINGVSSYIMARNLLSANRPQNVTNRPVPAETNATIEFTCPAIKDTEIAGKKDCWIRVRLASGEYGKDSRLVLTPGATAPYTLDEWKYIAPSFKAPVIASLGISYTYTYPAAPAVTMSHGWAYNNFQYAPVLPGSTFSPFRVPGETQAALYLGFDRAFAPKPASLFVAAEEGMFTTPPAVVWEYWNGSAWKNLGVQDGTANLTESGTLEFIGPTNASAAALFGIPAPPRHWIRARMEAGEKQGITLLGAYANTTWARHCTTIRNEPLGSSTETPNAEFTLSRFPVLEGLKLEVREPDRPSEEELALLRAEEGEDVIQPADQGQASSRGYWVRWHRVDHFRFSGKRSRHYVIDWSSGRVRFGNGVQGMIPSAGRENVRAAWYQSGGGSKGNVARNAVTVLKRSIPFVEKAFNVDRAGGGSEGEMPGSVMVRGPQAIKHRDRAVTLEDYEWLAKEASFQVARARCLGAKTRDDAGTVRLIIVPLSEELQPSLSQGLVRQVKDYINTRARRIGTANLSVIGPKYVVVSVEAIVFPERLEEADLVRRRVRENLTAFFHPLFGGPDRTGWEFGRDVYVSEVCKVIEDTEGVHHAEDVALSSVSPAFFGVDYIPVADDALVASGDHAVTISLTA
jgi:hypothetical protein